jgi:Na+-translocating ferredoxin:NAD+ oxidoreductase RnfD subunit
MNISPFSYVVFLLFVPWILGWGNIAFQNPELALNPLLSLLAISAGATIAIGIGRLFRRKKNIPNTIITVIILAILLPYSRDFWILGIELLSGFVAIICALFLRFFGRSIFNPAAFGALAAGIFSNFLFPYFGVDSLFYIGWVFSGMQYSFFDVPLLEFFSLSFPHPFFSFILFLPVFFYSIWKFRKFFITVAFLATFFVYLLFLGESLSVIGTTMISGTMLLFCSVMLGDPKTSPVFFKEQLVYGSFVGILLASTLHFHLFSFSYIEILLIGNGVYFFWALRKHLFWRSK